MSTYIKEKVHYVIPKNDQQGSKYTIACILAFSQQIKGIL